MAGITRQVLIDLAQNIDLAIKEQSLTIHDLHNADECFLTGTGAELIPVANIDGREIEQCPGPVFRHLDELFGAYVKCETA